MSARGRKGSDAELLFEKWLAAEGWTYHRAAAAGFVTLPGGRKVCKSHDLFGCLDFVAFKTGRDTLGVQVTTQSGRTARRRKIEKIDWPGDWHVAIVSHEAIPDPAHLGLRKHYWRFEYYMNDRLWEKPPRTIEFDPKAVEASWRTARAAEKASKARGKT